MTLIDDAKLKLGDARVKVNEARAKVDGAKAKLEEAKDVVPADVREQARLAADSARRAADDAAKLASVTADAAGEAVGTGRRAFVEARAEGRTLTDAAREATHEAFSAVRGRPEEAEVVEPSTHARTSSDGQDR